MDSGAPGTTGGKLASISLMSRCPLGFVVVIWGLYRDYVEIIIQGLVSYIIWYILLHKGYIGILQKKMETTIKGLFRV